MLKDLLKRMEELELAAKTADPNTEEGKEIINRAELYSDRAKKAFSKGTLCEACNFLINELASYYNDIEEYEGKIWFYCDGDAVMREIGVAVCELMKKPQEISK